MTIQKLYEASLNHKNSRIASLHYKLNKGLANIAYPVLGKCKTGVDEKSDIIISLASYPDRIDTVHLTIMTLLSQNVRPRAVMLCLAKEQFPNGEKDLPGKLTSLKDKGLTIRFSEDLRPHKKYYYPMMENPDCYIITVDDDVLYPENLVELLMETSKEYPDTVVCTWAHRITLDGDGEISRPGEWKHETSGIEPSYSVIPTGIGGVLYPPGILDIEVFNQTSIRKLCLNADDLWLKAMAVRNHRKAVRINRPAKIYFSILKTQKTGLYYDNALKNKNDVAWDNIMQAYHECEEFLKESLLAER